MPQLAPIQISVINATTVLTDTEIHPVVEALQQQVTKDFRPVWGVDAELSFIPSGTPPPSGTWWLAILDDSDQAGALGYHDVTPRCAADRQGFCRQRPEIRYQLERDSQSRTARNAG